MKKLVYLSGIICLNLFLVGAFMRIAHIPGAKMMMVIGLGLFTVWFLPIAGFSMYKAGENQKSKGLYFIGFLCLFIELIGVLFKLNRYSGADTLQMIGIPLPFAIFLPLLLYYHIKKQALTQINFMGVMFLMLYIAIFTSLLGV